jgi:hypothetical protein
MRFVSARGSLLGRCVVHDVAVEMLCLRALGRLEPHIVGGPWAKESVGEWCIWRG